jgi:hypothetical protein
MHFLIQWFLVGALDAVAGRCPGGLIAIMSLGNAGHAATELAFLL